MGGSGKNPFCGGGIGTRQPLGEGRGHGERAMGGGCSFSLLVLHALFLFIALSFRNLIANLVFMQIKTHVGCDNYQNYSTTS